MAEKKTGLSLGMVIGSIAVGAAAGVFYYYRKAQIKKLAEDIIARVRPAEDVDDEPGDWDIRAGVEPEDAEDVNIVDSGISLESVEAEAESDETEEEAGEPEAEAGEPEAEAEPEAVESEDEDDDIERPKKPWFWSK